MSNDNTTIKYLRSCQLINSGVDFIQLSQLLNITMIEAVELMTQDDVYNRYFEFKKKSDIKKS